MDSKRRYKSYLAFDFILFASALALSIFGIVLIGSATKINISGTSAEYSSQILWLCLGLIILFLSAFIDYVFILKFYVLIYLVNILLLLLIFVMGTADENGVARWLYFGSFGMQPSEFTKLFLILFFARYLEKNKEKINTPFFILSYIGLLFIPILLIAVQPSLSACLIPLIIGAVLIFEAGLHRKIVFVAIIIGVVTIATIFLDSLRSEPIVADLVLTEYQIGRIRSNVLQEEAGDAFLQTGYAIQAIGSGQLEGKGLYNGTVNQLNYIAESHNDFIFSVLGEEFGFIGTVGVILIFFVIIIRILFIAHRTNTMSGKLICAGVATMFFAQVFINAGVNTGLLPNTGMTLPFLSYGGSSLMINLCSIGLVINVGMEKEKSIFEG
ncbi:MAG: FtsW/RodA/SpoVE family cell cycle protein [Lachnospirales bacterium]